MDTVSGLSPLVMVPHADAVVKGVMVSLLLTSVATWTLGLGKAGQLAEAWWRARAGLEP